MKKYAPLSNVRIEYVQDKIRTICKTLKCQEPKYKNIKKYNYTYEAVLLTVDDDSIILVADI